MNNFKLYTFKIAKEYTSINMVLMQTVKEVQEKKNEYLN